MQVTQEIIEGLMVLLPGFVTAGVIRALFVGEMESDFDKVVRSLIYSFIDYVIYALLIWTIRSRSIAKPPHINLPPALPSHPLDLLGLGAVAIAVGLFIAWYKTNDGHRWILRRLRITQRTTRVNVWHDVFHDIRDAWVIVNFADGRRLFGWPTYYNDDAFQPYLFLAHAEWLYEVDGEIKRLPAGEQGILLLPEMKIASIEFLPQRQYNLEAGE